MLEHLQIQTPLGGLAIFDSTICCIASLLIFLIWVYIVVWVYKDARRRGSSGGLWALLVLFFGLIALIIWFIVRPPLRPKRQRAAPGYMPPPPVYQPCPVCGQPMRVIRKYNRWYCDRCRQYR